MMGAIYAMWLRQIKRQWRSKARLIGSLAQPILFLVALGFGFGPVYAKAGGGNYLEFLAPGVITMAILFTGMFSGMEVIWDKKFGFLKETLVAPISRFKIMFGRTLGGATVAFFQGIVVFLICLIAGLRVTNWAFFPIALFFMFLIGFLFTALGTAIASKLEDMQAFPLIINFLIMPIFFLSGALFPLENVPTAIKIITTINPLTYGVSAVRYSLTGLAFTNLFLDFSVLIILTVIVVAIGTYLFSKTEA
ncbi:ABC transporter permease [Candidatus Pacearchaeota archaeon]|nr:ABC transporter permease [Candidatus Pacearchaeota archaeon]